MPNNLLTIKEFHKHIDEIAAEVTEEEPQHKELIIKLLKLWFMIAPTETEKPE